MADFEIKETKDSPCVRMDRSDKLIEIKGLSMPENAFEFYSPLINEVDKLFVGNQEEIQVLISLEYLNSMSNKQLLRFLKHLEQKFNKAKVEWLFASGDDLMKLKGEELQSICTDMVFEIKVRA